MPETNATESLSVVRLLPSRRLHWAFAATLVVLAVLPLLALWPRGLSAWPWLIPLGLFWGLIGASWRRFARAQRDQPEGIEHSAGGWFLWWGNQREPGEPTGQWLLWPGLQWLSFEAAGRRWHITCLPDSAPPGQRRRLRQWMKLEGP